MALKARKNPSRYICETSGHPIGSGFKSSKSEHVIDVKTGEIISRSVYESRLSKKNRYDLKDSASEVLLSYYGSNPPIKPNGYKKRHRTCDCMNTTISSNVQIHRSSSSKSTSYSGLVQCGSVWTCPVCAGKINERRSSEMRQAFDLAKEQGYQVSLLTLTAPHTSGDKIEDLSVKMRKAITHFWGQRSIKKWKKQNEVLGHIRSFEVRHGQNGWHPHFHILIFSKESLLSDKDFLLDYWQRAALSAGLDCPNDYGLDIRNGDYAGEYINKFANDGEFIKTSSGDNVTWDMADEMTKGNTKQGKNGSLSPWDILRKISDESLSDTDRRKYRMLFLFYARAMHGVAQLRWSNGLKKHFHIDEKSDQDLVEEQENDIETVGILNLDEWRYIRKKKKVYHVLEITEQGGSYDIALWLFENFYQKNGNFDNFYTAFINRHLSVSSSVVLVA